MDAHTARIVSERGVGGDTPRRDALLACAADLRRWGLSLGEHAHVRRAVPDPPQASKHATESASAGSSEGCVAVCVAVPAKLAAGTVALTPIARLNCGAAIGDSVVIERAVSVVACARLGVVFEGDGVSEAGVAAHVSQHMEGRVVAVGNRFRISLYGRARQFRVVSADPVDASRDTATTAPVGGSQAACPALFRVTRATAVSVLSSAENGSAAAAVDAAVFAVGGLASQMSAIREAVELPMRTPSLYADLGLSPPRGVLLHGPPGTGKTLLARAAAATCNCRVVVVNGPELVSKYYGETEARLRSVFAEAEAKAPAIVFIDEIDAICPRREDGRGEAEKRVVGTLLTLMDGAEWKGQGRRRPHVVVVGATNRPNALDPALRRPGRLDIEIEVGVPTADARLDILHVLLSRVPNAVPAKVVRDIASRTHGFVGADLAALVKEAALHALKRACGEGLDDSAAEDAVITPGDLTAAARAVAPSAMREVAVEVPKVRWDDIGGQEETKRRLREAVEWPLQHPAAFARMGIRPPKGILLYGPPGCSKTLMAKALATESELNFLAVKGPQLFSKWVGESERAVREVFRKARAASPSIVFFDEIDSMAGARGEGASGGGGGGVFDRVLSQLLAELDGIESLGHVTVVAATNRPDLIDKALLRPGRIDRMIYVAPPDRDARLAILGIATRIMPLDGSVSLDALADRTAGRSGAEIAALCREAAMCAMEEDADASCVLQRHFESAVARVPGRITPEMLAFYDRYRSKFGARG